MQLQDPSMVITDDDPDFRETLRHLFEPCGFRTLLAADGEEALNIVLRESVHVMLLDMHMPRLDGLQTARRLKQIRQVIPCILVSARADEVRETAESRQAFFSFVNKPVSSRELIQVVREAMQAAYSWSPKSSSL